MFVKPLSARRVFSRLSTSKLPHTYWEIKAGVGGVECRATYIYLTDMFVSVDSFNFSPVSIYSISIHQHLQHCKKWKSLMILIFMGSNDFYTQREIFLSISVNGTIANEFLFYNFYGEGHEFWSNIFLFWVWILVSPNISCVIFSKILKSVCFSFFVRWE